MNEKGQALIESVMALWLLVFTFVCVYYTCLLAVDKLRALDAAYYAGRIIQVNGDTSPVASWCLGRTATITQKIVSSPGAKPSVNEVLFQYMPRTFPSLSTPWQTVMRTPGPDLRFLAYSWPNAKKDPPADEVTLNLESGMLQLEASR
jgi:hypothetical protein